MKAVVVTRTGGPEVLAVEDRPEPEPGPGQLLVAVSAAGINFIDTYQRAGVYPVQLPLVLGSEGAGTVEATGPGVSEFSPGDRVAWSAAPGSYAEKALVDADRAVPVPDAVSAEQAAAVMLQGMTAHYLACAAYPAQPGDVALVHAAAGGVGLLLTQLVVRRGGRVLGTVSTEAKEKLAREAGAADVIRYTETDFAPVARELTGGRGVDVVYDGVGKTTFDGSLASLRTRGTLVLFGGSSGQVPPFDVQRLNSGGSLYLTRPTLVHYVATREELLERAGDVLGLVGRGELSVRIGGTYPLDAAHTAHEDLESRRTTGKLLLIP